MIGAITGGMELAIILLVVVVPGIPAWLVHRDVTGRDTAHPYAWPAMTFVSVALFYGAIPWFIFYFVVRDDIGEVSG